MRDESMYSTSTQKQSFDSVNYSERMSSLKYPPMAGLNTFDMNSKTSSNSGANGDIMLNAININNGQTIVDDHMYSMSRSYFGDTNGRWEKSPYDHLNEDDQLNVTYSNHNGGDIRISVVREESQFNGNGSGLSNFFRSLFNWRQPERSYGYYSPPPDHPINDSKKINFKIDPIIPKQYPSDQDMDFEMLDDGIISNSSMKDLDKAALEDELSAYMAELRMREKR